jgi:hypothetical protein
MVKTTEPKETDLIVFLDAKPSESIDVSKDEFLCFTALTAGFKKDFGFKQFKKTRTIKRKIRTVKKLTEQIENGIIDVKAVSIVGKMNGHFVHWACETINIAYDKIGAEWKIIKGKPKSLIWEDHTFDLKDALGISIYSSILAIIAMRFSIFAKNQKKHNIIFFLDSLPKITSAGMKLMKAISMNSDVSEKWLSNTKYGVSFEIGNLFSYSNEFVSKESGKNHPMAILADWLSVASLAKVSPKQIQIESGFTSVEISIFNLLWEAVNSKRSYDLVNVDDPEVIKKVKSHIKK